MIKQSRKTNRTVTEKILEEKLDGFGDEMDMKFQTWADVIIGKLREEIKEFRSDIMIGIDKIMKRIDDIDANTAIIGKDIDELKDRVAVLEQKN